MVNNSLTKEELQKVNLAQDKWFPVLLQSYSTSVLDMMASPFKKSILYLLVYCLIVYIYFVFVNKNKKMINSYILYIILGGLFVFCSCYYKQWRLNQNLIEVALRSENRLESKQFDFKDNMVVQGDLLRGSVGGSNVIDMVSGAYMMNDIYRSRKGKK